MDNETPKPLETMDAQYPKEAFHDPETGMYRLPDPEKSDAEFVQDESGLYVPRPTYKSVRIVNFAYQYHIEVDETASEIIDRFNLDVETFHDPTYNTEVHIAKPNEWQICSVLEGWKDIEEMRDGIKQAETAKRIAKLELAAQLALREQQAQRVLSGNRNHQRPHGR